jgi:hypothetical protein
MAETETPPDEKRRSIAWERIGSLIVGTVLLITGVVRNDFAIMVLGAGAFGVPGVINLGKPQAKTSRWSRRPSSAHVRSSRSSWRVWRSSSRA